MFADEFDGLLVDDRLDDAVQRLTDDRLDLLDVPARRQLRQVDAHPFHLVVIGAGGEVDQLGIRALEDIGAADQAAVVQRSCEGQGTGLRKDRLVEVEECS